MKSILRHSCAHADGFHSHVRALFKGTARGAPHASRKACDAMGLHARVGEGGERRKGGEGGRPRGFLVEKLPGATPGKGARS